MKEIFDHVSIKCSRITTHAYSTSFSLGILSLERSLRNPIHTIYGFVRFADEIVDSFHGYDKKALLTRLRNDTYTAIAEGISLNPILNSFQATVNTYKIEDALIDSFLNSMEIDLSRTEHNDITFKEYIYGSAEAVGLMCLRVFCHQNDDLYDKLKEYAMSLGAAFQKVNFLRDLRADYAGLGRTYFPGMTMDTFNEQHKREIEKSILADFQHALQGIKQLPKSSRCGVYVAYVYYLALFKKIRNTPSELIMKSRIRIRNRHKATLLAYSLIRHQFNLI